ncbi:MAG: 5-formyltetrahydrofolate cyclo-ligase [Bacteroidales bacterium]|nr:5-formyltetrahydrofolate cyclo-ligase [Bacteroidales bacterium]
MQNKTEIRQKIRDLKRAVPMDEKLRRSENILRHLEQSPLFKTSRVVLMYWSMADEVQTHKFVNRWYQDKIVLLPCVDGNNLRLRQYSGPECMVSGPQFGIGEPTGQEWTDMEAIDLIVVPGVAFDRKNNRMGRGRGFYDRLLKSTPKATKFGVAYDFQIFDEIPVEPHDVPMDFVVSETKN